MVTSKTRGVAVTFAIVKLPTIVAIVLVTAAALSQQGHAAPVSVTSDVRDQFLKNGPRDSSGKPEYGITLASSMAKISPKHPELARLEFTPRIVPQAARDPDSDRRNGAPTPYSPPEASLLSKRVVTDEDQVYRRRYYSR